LAGELFADLEVTFDEDTDIVVVSDADSIDTLAVLPSFLGLGARGGGRPRGTDWGLVIAHVDLSSKARNTTS